jgi:hypothetical protein
LIGSVGTLSGLPRHIEYFELLQIVLQGDTTRIFDARKPLRVDPQVLRSYVAHHLPGIRAEPMHTGIGKHEEQVQRLWCGWFLWQPAFLSSSRL